jgi:hypothetical protein
VRAQELEVWVLKLLELVKTKQLVEDSRVELKAQWPTDIPRTARQLAGHANSAQGSLLLWIIGVDEDTGEVKGADKEELANWFPKVQAQYDEICPDLQRCLSVPFEGGSVVALLFETDRAPYLVKNPSYSKSNGGPVEREVPWRANNSTRTARRADLLKLLMPLVVVPEFEIRKASLSAHNIHPLPGKSDPLGLYLQSELYVIAPMGQALVIPFHHCAGTIKSEDIEGELIASDITLNPPDNCAKRFLSQMPGARRPESLTIESTQDEVIINGPGRAILKAKYTSPVPLCLEGLMVTAIFRFSVLGTDLPSFLKMDLNSTPSLDPNTQKWKWEG